MARVERGSLLIADLSGYTHYMASIDLDTIHVVCELLETVANALSPFEVVKLEGDAVFCHAPDGAVGGEETLSVIAAAYEAFLEHASWITNDGGCSCPACNLLPGLGLKFVLHHGDYAIHRIAGSAELVGPDVIAVHRLLKSDVGTQWGRDYVLLTDRWARRLGVDVDALSGEQHSETYEHIGRIDCVILNLARSDGHAAFPEPRDRTETASPCTYVGTDDAAGPISVNFRRSPS